MRVFVNFLFLFLFTLSGCKPDVAPAKEITQEDLVGEWEIFFARRNGKVTKSLESGNFVFGADNSVSSNLFETSNTLNFSFDKGTISIEGDPNMNSLKLRKLQNDTMVLTSKMKVFKMEFHLKKK